jgi:hypothetical protein
MGVEPPMETVSEWLSFWCSVNAEARRVEETIRTVRFLLGDAPDWSWNVATRDVRILLTHIDALTARLAEAERVAKQNERAMLMQQKDRFEAEQAKRLVTIVSDVISAVLSPAPEENK